MRTALLLTIGATPGAAIGYLVLMGYLLRKVQPVPIAFVPAQADAISSRDFAAA